MTHERALQMFIDAVQAGATMKEAQDAVYFQSIEAGEDLQDADAIAAIARKDYEALKV